MELFTKTNKLLTVFAKYSNLDTWQSFEYTSTMDTKFKLNVHKRFI